MRDEPQPFTIREATQDDVAEVARLGRIFYEEAAWSDVAEWDDHSILQTLKGLVANDDGIVLVLCRKGVIRGMAGGLVHPLYFNHAHRTGQELFWWLSPDERDGAGAALLTALEDAARAAGAQSWAMIALDMLRPEAIGAVYARRGYRPSERTYIKRLN